MTRETPSRDGRPSISPTTPDNHQTPRTTTRVQRGPRSRHGCSTCRARHVKCDERPGGCTNCERLVLVCDIDYKNHTSNEISRKEQRRSAGEFSSTRTRTYRSCVQCRTSKTKCSGDKPECKRCRMKGQSCVYETDTEPVWTRRMKSVSARAESSDHIPPTNAGNVVEDDSQRSEQQECASENFQHDTDQANQASHSGHLQIGTQTLPQWLTALPLPTEDQVKALIEHYFWNVHPLRCFAFLHKPTFLQNLGQELMLRRRKSPLILIMCALGAQFYVLECLELATCISSKAALTAGRQWARQAQRIVLAEIDRIKIENLMATVLLHDYALRMGNFTNAFMLCGIMSRMAQALQINLEYSTDIFCEQENLGPSVTIRECRRRLMWSCYTADALVGSGVDQLTLINERDIKIQLPCNERAFLQQLPCFTEVLEKGKRLKFIPLDLMPDDVSQNMGIMAQFLRHIEIRKRILRYIKHLDTAKLPWLPGSEFRSLDAESQAWYDSLPTSLSFSQTSIYIRKESNQLGDLCVLHCAYHQTICDLYRLGAPALYKLRGAFEFPAEQQEFLRHIQSTLLEHAKSLASITHEVSLHGVRFLADTWLPTIVYDSSRIMLYHLTQVVDPATENVKSALSEILPHLQHNLETLKTMQALHIVAEPLRMAAQKMLTKFQGTSGIFRQNIIPDNPYHPPGGDDVDEHPSAPGSPAQTAPDYVLNPLSIYRMARKVIPEKHTPEKLSQASPSFSEDASPGRARRSLSRPNQLQEPQDDVTTPARQEFRNDSTNIDSTAENEIDAEGMPFVNGSNTFFDQELQDLFTSELGWTWRDADTVVGSVLDSTALGNPSGPVGDESGELGLLPWAPTHLQKAFELDWEDGNSYMDLEHPNAVDRS